MNRIDIFCSRFMRFTLIFIYVTVGCICLVQSQTSKVEPLSSNEGLTDDYSHYNQTLYRDSFGYIWISTYSGLNRYDGYEITRYNQVSTSPNDLPSKRLGSITGDRDNNLWMGEEYFGMIFYDRKLETFEELSDKLENNSTFDIKLIYDLSFDSSDVLSIFTTLNGTYYLNTRTNEITEPLSKQNDFGMTVQYSEPMDNGSNVYAGSRVIIQDGDLIFTIDEEPSYFIIELANNKVYFEKVKTSDRSIYDFKLKRAKKFGPDEDISEYFDVKTGYDIFNVRIKNPAKFTNGTFDFKKTFGNKNLPFDISDLILDVSGDYIYSSIFDGAGKILKSNLSFKITKIDSIGGALKKIGDKVYFSRPNFVKTINGDSVYTELSKGIDHSIYSDWNLCINADSNIVTNNGIGPFSTSVYNAKTKELIKTFPSSPHDQMELLQDGVVAVDTRQGIGTDDTVIKFIGEYYEEVSGKKFEDYRVFYFNESSNGDIWIATLKGEVIRIYNNNHDYEWVVSDPYGNGKLRNSKVYYIYEAYGKVYLCNAMGIDVFDPKTNTYDYLDLDLGTTPFYVKGMVHDDKDQIWIMDYNILYCYNLNDKSLKKYPVPEEYKIFVNPCKDLVFHENKILYKRNDGIVSIDLDELGTSRIPENVIFQDLFVDRAKIYPNDNTGILDSSLLYQSVFSLNYNQRNIGFKFVSVDSKELFAEYEYRLIGLYDEWINIEDERVLHFTNLSPGKYEFEVRVKSSNGKWSRSTSKRSFEVLAPWYATWLAFLIYTFIIGGIVYTIYRLQVDKIKEKIKLRDKISKDLHDDVGGILTGLRMQSEMLEMTLDGEDKETAGLIRQLGQQALSSMRDTVWAIDSSKDDVVSLLYRMKDHSEITLRGAGLEIEYQIDITDNKQTLPTYIRQQTYLIYKEIITNTAKHSNGDKAVIRLRIEKKMIFLEVHDNGKVADFSNSGQGLSSMENRAETINGILKIDTTTGFKTTFTVNW